jgi:hypothetical protein
MVLAVQRAQLCTCAVPAEHIRYPMKMVIYVLHDNHFFGSFGKKEQIMTRSYLIFQLSCDEIGAGLVLSFMTVFIPGTSVVFGKELL